MLLQSFTEPSIAMAPFILVALLVIMSPFGICMLSALVYFLIAWRRSMLSIWRKISALVWFFASLLLLGVPTAACVLHEETLVQGCLLFLLLLVQPCLICHLLLRFNFKRSLMSILYIYGSSAVILAGLPWVLALIKETCAL